ncbi:uncharacterized protein LOC100678219 isoform X2 [Nasonia vitripennis]|uniref:Uncharacterized protein n=1 Tax=Nasonia vitripennis TaxID=7425 RepID=A0A7M7QLC0_NASVI|nr:uncharacterized protein LOC100678219 isoform X2 [Nasonia vitripennis]
MTRLRRVQCLLVGLLLLISATTALKCPDREGTPGREIVCYTSRSNLELLENAICRCTTLVHQGHDLQDLDASGIKSLRDEAKEANPSIRVLLSVSDKHEILKSSAKTRQEAVTHLTDALKEVDGVELNVTAGSKERLVSFVKGLKDEMVNKSLEKMILLAVPTKPEDLAKQFELKELSKYVDLFTVATHYLRDNDEAYRAFHPSRLMGLFDMLNTDSLVDLISGMGAPKHKILISVPVSAYQFTLKRAQDNTPRSLTVEEQPAVFDRKKLCDAMNDGEWTVERDEDLTAPYAFKNTTWIAFEDETSLKIKGKYVILRELAGMGLRDAENDSKNDCGISVAQAVRRAFTEMKRKTREVVLSSLEKDLKGTEIAYPRHVRSSDFRIVRVVDTAGKIRAVRENTQTAFACPHQGYFVHPKSCNRFYRCVKFNQEVDDYSVFEFDCPAGLAFDEKTEVCTWPGSISRGSACPGSSEIEPVSRGRFRCPSRAGYYADPNNCRWFFACYDLGGSEMVPYEFRCPFGLVFDESRLICEWPWKVPNCNGPGHGDGHSIYAYGGSLGEQGGHIPQGGIIGQGGFVGQGGYAGHGFENFGINQGGQGTVYNSGAYDGQNSHFAGNFGAGADYDGQTYNAGDAGAAYDGQSYNAGGYGGQTYNAAVADAGAKYSGQTYNSAGSGAGTGYSGQTYNSAGAGAGAGFEGQTYNAAEAGAGAGSSGQSYNSAGAGTGAGYSGQTYNSAGAGTGAGHSGQTYNSAGTAAGAGFDGQTYNAAGAGSGTGYSGQTYNSAEAGAGYSGQAHNGASSGADDGDVYNGQTYNAAAANSGAGYDEQKYNAGGSAAGGASYNTVGVAGPGYNGQTYSGDNAGAGYNGQSYNAGGASGSGAGYATQTYNAAGTTGADVGRGSTFSPNVYNQAGENGAVPARPDNNGQTYNAGGAVDYDAQTYNPAGSNAAEAGRGPGFRPNVYNQPGPNGHSGGDYDEQNYGGPGPAGAGIDYDGQNYHGGEGAHNAHGADCNGHNYNGNGAPAGVDTGRGVEVNANGFNGQGGVVTNSADYDDRGGQSTIYSNDGSRTTQFNAGGAGTTIGVNNFAGNTRIPAGLPGSANNFASGSATGYAAGSTNGYTGGVTTGYAAGSTNGINNFAGETVTPQNGLVTGGRLNTNFAQGQNTNYNTFGSTVQTGLFGGSGTTIGIDLNRANGRTPNPGFSTIAQGGPGLFNAGKTQYTDDAGLKVYNSTYSPNAGFPTSTIIPFVPRENTFNPNGVQGLNPVNFMGLSSTENFGRQYANQAEKSFATQGRTPTGFAFNGRTQNNQNFNTATNIYDYSKASLAGVTPSITLIRDGTNNGGTAAGNPRTTTGVTNFGSSTVAPANFNTDAGQTNAYGNSQIFGSSLSTSNNQITRFPAGTDNFRFNGNTAANTGFRTTGNDATSYNQGTTANQNPYTATGFTQPPQNAVTPATIAQNFNNQGTPVPGVVPLNNARPSVELDNTGLFGNNFDGPTSTVAPDFRNPNIQSSTPQNYRTNEYFDNGGRGTIRYNNGLVTNKVTETDIQDYRTSPYTRIPNSFIINGGNAENEQSTIQKADDSSETGDGIFTRGGFTKTGPTKTGITTAQVGGSASYVLGPSTLRPRPNPDFIGEQAFATNFQTEGAATNFGAKGSTTNFGTTAGASNFKTAGPSIATANFNTAGGTANFHTDGAAANFAAKGITNNFGFTAGAANFNTAGATNFNTDGAATNFGARGTASNFGSTAGAANFNTAGATNFNTDGAATNFGARGTANNFGTTAGAANFNTAGSNFGTAGATNFNTDGAATNFGARGNNFGTTAGAANFNTAGTNFGTAGATNFNTDGAATNFGARETASNFGTTAGASNFNTAGSTANFGTTNAANFGARGTNFDVTGSTANFGTSQFANGFTSNDISRTNTASGANTETAGYSYPKPLIQLEVEGISTTPVPPRTSYFESTTPSPISNAQSFNNQNSVIIESAQKNRGFSTTISPVGFTTGPLENFRTTVFDAAKLPQAVTTVRPVIDTSSRTVISSTPIPAVISTQRPYQSDVKTYLDVGVSFDQGNDYASTGNFDYSDVTSNAEQGNFGQRVTGQSRTTNINYQQGTTNARGLNENSPLVTSTQDYNSFTGSEATAQTGSLRSNEANDFGSTVTIPNQVYLPSSTLAPEAGVTFRRPIVSAEFSQGQFGQSSAAVNSQNLNAAADFTSQGTANRVLTNQASSNAGSQRISGGVLRNQASQGFASQGSAEEFARNQATGNFGARESANAFFGNQASSNFASQGQVNEAFGNQASAEFGSRGSANGIFGSQGSGNFGSQVSAGGNSNNQANSFSNQNQGFSGQTRTLIGSDVVTSIGGAGLNSDIIRQNSGSQQNVQIISEFNDGGNFGVRNQQSTTVAPEVTTYAGDFSRTRGRIDASGEFGARNQNRKVIVKLSDLHPLILNKLGAECTCRADPFAVFRGSNRQTLPINSRNRGPVDLANYDESDIYVDVDIDKENEKEIEFAKNIPSNRLIKTSNARFNEGGDDSSIVVSSRGEPSSTAYLPPTSARPPSTYLPPQPSNEYVPTYSTTVPPSLFYEKNEAPLSARTQDRQPLLIRVEDNSDERQQFAQRRAGKALFDGPVGSPNNLRDQGESFDRYGPGGLRSNDEKLEGGLDCVRPGLFRHPKICNKFYACHWDEWKKRYTLHVFNCPVHLAFDSSAGACNYPSKGPACQDNKLLI